MIIPMIIIKESIIKIIIPGLIDVDLEIKSANKSIPPGLMCSRNIKPIPIPIMIPPRITFVMIGRCTKPFNGVNKSMIVEVKINPRRALIK